jgi:CBS domain-containing protein
MRVREFMTHEVWTVRSTDRLDTAARKLWEGDCGALPVLDDTGLVVAMVTDRDVCMAAYLQGRPLSAIPVSTAMSPRLVACGPEETIAAAEACMRDYQVRRLPVIDAGGRLVGILSLNDIAIEATRERRAGRRHRMTEQVGTTLGAIGRHRDAPPPQAHA